ncbi:hypothetical protein [Spirosoma pollinicola]|uniref:Uncharacterized protein n=1 Tax=Spirosoma pollinicola TaxID=2057025 RepID=A0A2K8YTQ1_9BACT|nr:hypothetical protein [Spirosoma pollinicola]AUD00938.1 hypothetical protein CWM47_03370 [Spirosoma pollinicola]
MVKQYPYSLWVQTQSGGAIKDANGNFLASSSVWVNTAPCRDEESAAGQTLTLEDSTVTEFASLIQLPTYCPVLSEGTPIEVREGNTVRVSGRVKRFSKGQLHSRLWV